jgi:hypothetical protein
MSFKFQVPGSKFQAPEFRCRIRVVNLFCLFTLVLLSASCGSIPNLDPPECTDARLTVKEFYSYHLGNEMRFSQENLKKREKFLTPEYFKSLQTVSGENDIFTTNSLDFPKTFRVGGCKVIDAAKTEMEVLLFWKDETRTEQRAIHVEVVKQGDRWLVNRVN